jgi:hypothetical protein
VPVRTTFKILAGVFGLTCIVGTVVLGLDLLAMERSAKVLLAAYMGIGGFLVGGYFLFFAIKGD